MAKVLVTGGAGFIGSAVVRQLVERGRRVRVLLEPGVSAAGVAGLPVEIAEGSVLDLSWYGDRDVQLSLGGAFHAEPAPPQRHPGWLSRYLSHSREVLFPFNQKLKLYLRGSGWKLYLVCELEPLGGAYLSSTVGLKATVRVQPE